MDQQPTSDELKEARKQGRKTGYRSTCQGADCPYRFEPIILRNHWFDGFSEGRTLYLRDNPQERPDLAALPAE